MGKGVHLNESCAYIVSDREVTFYGCIGVEEYSESAVRLKQRDLNAIVRGNGLVLSTFMGEEISVKGRVCSVTLERINEK